MCSISYAVRLEKNWLKRQEHDKLLSSLMACEISLQVLTDITNYWRKKEYRHHKEQKKPICEIPHMEIGSTCQSRLGAIKRGAIKPLQPFQLKQKDTLCYIAGIHLQERTFAPLYRQLYTIKATYRDTQLEGLFGLGYLLPVKLFPRTKHTCSNIILQLCSMDCWQYNTSEYR